ncbi:glycoside hydrolase domain-containing protein [Streptomyces sp. Ru73]|uniref:glycoside hydrolase domain-containing protein n=1 Tax=Streptomyces sp. Ru73 TaxID=2080748 RepID=UPI0021565C31|nr:glycoside hydrolase domain-containing protein [Streptomyces sp. Ru73]
MLLLVPAVGLAVALAALLPSWRTPAASGGDRTAAAPGGSGAAAGRAGDGPVAADDAAVSRRGPAPRAANPVPGEGPSLYKGFGIDTCEAPAVSSLRAWNSTRYRAIGVYFAGHGRACPKQHNLSPQWFQGAKWAGWKVLPVYLGAQSPCVKNKHKRRYAIGSDPYQQGTNEARVAVQRARAYGIMPRSPIYLDIEAYDLKNQRCKDVTLRFIRSWSREVRRFGYIAGFYSSANSGVRHMAAARAKGITDLPSVIWFARWHVAPSTYGEKWLPDTAWQPNRRIHQYAGHVLEEHGGRKLRIDRNWVDAPVAVIK